MTKIKKALRQRNIILGILVLVAVVAVGFGVRAYTNHGETTINVAGDYNEAGETMVEPEEEMFSAVASAQHISSPICVNDECTWIVSGDFADASTTILAFADPFESATTTAGDVVINGTFPYARTGATSTVDMVRLYITGVATSTFKVFCGADADKIVNTTGVNYLLYSEDVATSTKTIIENDTSTSSATVWGGIGGGVVDKIFLNGARPYFKCFVTTYNDAYDGGITGNSNTFAGSYSVRINRLRH